MKKTIYFSLVAFLIVSGCSKVDDFAVVDPGENQLKSARVATPISSYETQQYWDNTDVLQTSLWNPLKSYTAPLGYPAYDKNNYDVMAHFQYFSPEDLIGAVVEFTFPHIIDFVPHMLLGRTYTVNKADNITVISCITDLKKAHWEYPVINDVVTPTWTGSPMFCFMVKVDCSKGNNGLTTFWTDMKVNGVSVKGTIKNKVFACN